MVADTELSISISGFASETNYVLYVAAEDDNSEPNMQIEPTKIIFKTVDITGPSLLKSNPAGEATEFPINSNLSLSFNELIKAGTGNITIKKTSDDGVFQVFDVTSDVSISDSSLFLNPSSDFALGTSYYLLVDATAITDTAGNAFAGISNKTTLNLKGQLPL